MNIMHIWEAKCVSSLYVSAGSSVVSARGALTHWQKADRHQLVLVIQHLIWSESSLSSWKSYMSRVIASKTFGNFLELTVSYTPAIHNLQVQRTLNLVPTWFRNVEELWQLDCVTEHTCNDRWLDYNEGYEVQTWQPNDRMKKLTSLY